MGFAQAVSRCFAKYTTFSGRAIRSEFWWFMLFTIVGSIVFDILDAAIFGMGPGNVGVMGAIFSLVVLLPSISVTVRRLHDTDRSGWWYWLLLVPLIGIVVMIIWWASKSSHGSNRFGDDPLSGLPDEDDEDDDGSRGDGSSDGDFLRSSIPTVQRS